MKKLALITLSLFAVAAVSGAAWAGGGGNRERPRVEKKDTAPANGVHVDFSLNDKPVKVTVSGKVTDATTGRPIPDAFVRGRVYVAKYYTDPGYMDPTAIEKMPYAETNTGRNGDYTLEFTTALTVTGWNKGSDSVCLAVGADGYESRPLWVKPNVTPDKTDFRGVDIPLRRGRRLIGTVVDERGQPVEGATVLGAGGASGGEEALAASGRTVTDTAGAFSMWVAKTATSNYGPPRCLEISKRGMGFLYVLPLNKDDLGRLTLPRGAAAVAGRVVDADGKGVAGCEVLSGPYWRRPERTKTDSDGYYKIEGLKGEPSLRDMDMRLNGFYREYGSVFSVWVMVNPDTPLSEAPSFKFTPQDGQTFTGPDLVIGRPGISGTVIATNPDFNLEWLEVQLDDVTNFGARSAVDSRGRFALPVFPTPGKHRLSVFYYNRGDRSIGTILFEAKDGKTVENIQLPLEPLAEAKVQFIDVRGNPVEGIRTSARSKLDDGAYGGFGGASDASGQSTVFLWPGARQYVSGWDPDRKLFCAEYPVVAPKPLESLRFRITMVAPSAISARLVTLGGSPVADRDFRVWISYADGDKGLQLVHTDLNGRFETPPAVRPGVVKLTLETDSEDCLGSTKSSAEIAPGQGKDFGDISLKERRLFKVHGRVIPSETYTDTGGFICTFDPKNPHSDGTGANGEFDVFCVPQGRQRFAVYPRFDYSLSEAGCDLGHADVYVGGDIKNLEVRLDPMAVVKVEIDNEAGEPLMGMFPASWSTADHKGACMMGRGCDVLGNAILYVTPNKTQFVGAWDPMGQYVVKEHKEVNLKPGENADVKVIMKMAN